MDRLEDLIQPRNQDSRASDSRPEWNPISKIQVQYLDGLWKAIGLALVMERKALAPKEVRYLRHHMDLTQAELGGELRVSDQTVARWEKGETPIPGPADVALRMLFLASKSAQPKGGKVLMRVLAMLDDLRVRDEEEHPARSGSTTLRNGSRRKRAGSRSTLKLRIKKAARLPKNLGLGVHRARAFVCPPLSAPRPSPDGR